MLAEIPEWVENRLRSGSRVVVWFSCGAASTAAAKLVSEHMIPSAQYVYCDTLAEEHPDNLRYIHEIEKYIGQEILILKSKKYASISEVFEKTRYMAGIAGAGCTVQMKKVPRFAHQKPDDVHVFGFTLDEKSRLDRFYAANPDMFVWDILGENKITKKMCVESIVQAGIALPAMYGLGFKNNNCIGCVKAQSPAYWNLVRKHFPAIWEIRNKQSRDLNVRLARIKGIRVFLDEIPYTDGDRVTEDISCGPQCSLDSSHD